MTEFHKLLYERWLQVELQGIILLTSLLNLQILGLTTRCFESATPFKVDAMHMLVRYDAHDAR
jgi:hypothetical protein